MRAFVIAVLAVLAAGFGLLATAGAAFATHTNPQSAVEPVLVSGNASCGSIDQDYGESWRELKDDSPSSGTLRSADGFLTVDVTLHDAKYFDYTASPGVDAVLVKGGPNASAYVYPVDSTGDVNLHAPLNGSEPYGLSHISFCYDLTGSLSGVKWHDLDADGVRDGGEPVIEGYKLFLDVVDDDVYTDGEPIATTNAMGVYTFTDLASGTYEVREAPDSLQTVANRGFLCSFPSPTCAHTVAVDVNDASKRTFPNRDFGNYRNATVIVDKVTTGLGADQDRDFNFTTTGLGAGFALDGDDTPRSITGVRPNTSGAYTATEGADAEYDLIGVDCDDSDSTQNGTGASRTATVNVSSGETVTCTFTNRKKPGDIELEKKPDAGTVNAGDQIGFVITATNVGPGSANGVVVTDTLPTQSGLTWSIAADSSPGCSIAGGKLTCNFGTIAAGASKSVHITSPTTKDSCAKIDNTANVTTTDSGSDESTGSVTVLCAKIEVTKVADQGTVSAGDRIGFTITAKNTGAGEARGVTVTDTLPTQAGLSWSIDAASSDAGCAISGGVLTCNFGTLASGASNKVHITSPTTKDSCAKIDNTARVTTTNDGSDEDTDSITVLCAEIEVTKTPDAGRVNAGSAIGFTITAKNTGAGEARGVTVTDTLPTQAGLNWSIDAANSDAGCAITAGVLTCDFGTLAAGQSKKVHITSPTTRESCGAIDNTAEVTTTNDGSDSDTASMEVDCAAIQIVKDGPAFAYHGDTVTFTFLVTNPGNVPLANVTVTDDRCAPVTGPTEKRNGDQDELLEVGEEWVFTCSTTVAPHTGGEENPIHNIATATGEDRQGDKVTDTDDHDTPILHPAIQIDKTGPTGATAGDRVEFTLTVTNPGDTAIPANTLRVTDSRCDGPPEEVARQRNGAADPTPNTLDPGDSWIYRCFVQTTGEDSTITNVARADGRDVNDRPVSDDDDHVVNLQQVAPVVVESGASRLRGPSRCTNRPFTARVTGKRIQSVVWRIDGRVVARFSSQTGEATRVNLRVSPKRYGRGLHRLTARVTYNPAAQTRGKTIRMTFRLCARRSQLPRFTG